MNRLGFLFCALRSLLLSDSRRVHLQRCFVCSESASISHLASLDCCCCWFRRVSLSSQGLSERHRAASDCSCAAPDERELRLRRCECRGRTSDAEAGHNYSESDSDRKRMRTLGTMPNGKRLRLIDRRNRLSCAFCRASFDTLLGLLAPHPRSPDVLSVAALFGPFVGPLRLMPNALAGRAAMGGCT